MKLTLQREQLLKPLQMMAGIAEKKQSMSILGNVLIELKSIEEEGYQLALSSTDTEVSLVARVRLTGENIEPGKITAPARKLTDICRALPNDAEVTLELVDNKLVINSGGSHFSLVTLPAEDFPSDPGQPAVFEAVINQEALAKLIKNTHFSMAQEDVRYYLNGLLLMVKDNKILAVATDGHRLARAYFDAQDIQGSMQVIVPRKGVMGLQKLLEQVEEKAALTITGNDIRLDTQAFTLTSKLISGRYPDYQKAIPGTSGKSILAQGGEIKQALTRAAVLSTDKFRSVRIQLTMDRLKISTNNTDQEQAEEVLEVDYKEQVDIDVGYNIHYLLDVFNVLPEGDIRLTFTDPAQVLVIESPQDPECLFVIMPMKF